MNRLITSEIVGIVTQLAWRKAWEVWETWDSQNLPNSQKNRKR